MTGEELIWLLGREHAGRDMIQRSDERLEDNNMMLKSTVAFFYVYDEHR